MAVAVMDQYKYYYHVIHASIKTSTNNSNYKYISNVRGLSSYINNIIKREQQCLCININCQKDRAIINEKIILQIIKNYKLITIKLYHNNTIIKEKLTLHTMILKLKNILYSKKQPKIEVELMYEKREKVTFHIETYKNINTHNIIEKNNIYIYEASQNQRKETELILKRLEKDFLQE